jgi:hypothetical protein
MTQKSFLFAICEWQRREQLSQKTADQMAGRLQDDRLTVTQQSTNPVNVEEHPKDTPSRAEQVPFQDYPPPIIQQGTLELPVRRADNLATFMCRLS